jgi:hypothetical protein
MQRPQVSHGLDRHPSSRAARHRLAVTGLMIVALGSLGSLMAGCGDGPGPNPGSERIAFAAQMGQLRDLRDQC